MTKEEAFDIIKTKKLKPIESGTSFHVHGETFEINGYLVKLYWFVDGDKDNPLIEIYNIDELFKSDYEWEQLGKSFLKQLPDSIYKRKLQLEEVAEKLKNRVLFPEFIERAKKFCKQIKIDQIKIDNKMKKSKR